MAKDASKGPVETEKHQLPAFVLVWDPTLIDPEDYAELIDALADLARCHGGKGLIRLRSPGFNAPVGSGVRT